MTAPVTCPACGEERLVDVDAAGWYFCQVCGRSGAPGPHRIASAPAASPAPAPPPDALAADLAVIVQRHLTPGRWHVAGIGPLAQWPASLQRELRETLGAQPGSVVLVLERARS